MSSLIETRPLGRSGRFVSSVSIGTAALALPYGPPGASQRPPSTGDAIDLINAALDRGITLVDTAPGYPGAEEIVGRATRGRECVVATKLSAPDAGWQALSPAQVRSAAHASVEQSLERLGRDRIDILQIHNANRDLIERRELPAAMAALKEEGLATLLGATVYDEDDALAAVESDVFDTVQVAYSVLDRRAERAVLPSATAAGTAVFARSVLLRGVLSEGGRHLEGPFGPLREAADCFREEVGADWGDLPGAALAFVLSRPQLTSALVGPRDGSELERLLDGAERFLAIAATFDTVVRLPVDLIDPRTWPEARVDV